jgi:hypothetical protein
MTCVYVFNETLTLDIYIILSTQYEGGDEKQVDVSGVDRVCPGGDEDVDGDGSKVASIKLGMAWQPDLIFRFSGCKLTS